MNIAFNDYLTKPFEPEELVLTANPGTPLEEVEAVLAQRRQMLAFEPPALHLLASLSRRMGSLPASARPPSCKSGTG